MKILPLAVIGCGFLALRAAFAHTELATTVPADESTVAEAPADLLLTFSEPVRLTALTIQLDDAPKQSLGPLPAAVTADFAIALPALADGHYVVIWRALSADTHVMNGEFMFAIDNASVHDAQMEHGETGAAPADAAPDKAQDAHPAHQAD